MTCLGLCGVPPALEVSVMFGTSATLASRGRRMSTLLPLIEISQQGFDLCQLFFHLGRNNASSAKPLKIIEDGLGERLTVVDLDVFLVDINPPSRCVLTIEQIAVREIRCDPGLLGIDAQAFKRCFDGLGGPF